MEGVEEHEEDDQNADRDDDREALHGALLVLELSAPGNEIARWEGQGRLYALLHFADDGSHVTPPDENSDGRDAQSRFAADIHTPAPDGHRRDLIERDAQPCRRIDEVAADRVDVAPRFFSQPDDDAEPLFSFPDLGRQLAAERRFDHVLNIRDVEAIAGRALPVDLDLQLGHRPRPIDESAGDSAHAGDRVKHILGPGPQHRGVLPEYLDHDLSVDLRDALQDVVPDWLGEARLDTGDGLEGRLHLLDQLLFRDFPRPLRLGFQIDEDLDHVYGLRVRAVLGTAGLRNDGDYLRKFQDFRTQAGGDP